MGGMIDRRREEATRLEGYFDVQLQFAEIAARRTSRTLSETCLRYTNLHRRLGLGRRDGGATSAEWNRYAAGLEQCASLADRLAWTAAFYVAVEPKEKAKHRFGCFSYELVGADDVVRIHFGNHDSADDSGPLARAKAERRRSELREMFGHIRTHEPHARTVVGSSWLYNLEAYRRLFPLEYAASRFEQAQLRLDGMSSWGQVLDFRGFVKPAIARAVLDNIETVDIAEPWKAFPLHALGAQSAIEHFYRFYDC